MWLLGEIPWDFSMSSDNRNFSDLYALYFLSYISCLIALAKTIKKKKK